MRDDLYCFQTRIQLLNDGGNKEKDLTGANISLLKLYKFSSSELDCQSILSSDISIGALIQNFIEEVIPLQCLLKIFSQFPSIHLLEGENDIELCYGDGYMTRLNVIPYSSSSGISTRTKDVSRFYIQILFNEEGTPCPSQDFALDHFLRHGGSPNRYLVLFLKISVQSSEMSSKLTKQQRSVCSLSAASQTGTNTSQTSLSKEDDQFMNSPIRDYEYNQEEASKRRKITPPRESALHLNSSSLASTLNCIELEKEETKERHEIRTGNDMHRNDLDLSKDGCADDLDVLQMKMAQTIRKEAEIYPNQSFNDTPPLPGISFRNSFGGRVKNIHTPGESYSRRRRGSRRNLSLGSIQSSKIIFDRELINSSAQISNVSGKNAFHTNAAGIVTKINISNKYTHEATRNLSDEEDGFTFHSQSSLPEGSFF